MLLLRQTLSVLTEGGVWTHCFLVSWLMWFANLSISSAASDYSIIQRCTSACSSQSRVNPSLQTRQRRPALNAARQSHRRQSHVVGVVGFETTLIEWADTSSGRRDLEWPFPGVSVAGKISHSLRGGRTRPTKRRRRDAIGRQLSFTGPQTHFYHAAAACETCPPLKAPHQRSVRGSSRLQSAAAAAACWRRQRASR